MRAKPWKPEVKQDAFRWAASVANRNSNPPPRIHVTGPDGDARTFRTRTTAALAARRLAIIENHRARRLLRQRTKARRAIERQSWSPA